MPPTSSWARADCHRDASLIQADRHIGGKVVDSVTGAGLPGIPIVFMKWDNNEPTTTMGYTDRQGNYNVAVSSGVWNVRLASSPNMNLAMQGYVPAWDYRQPVFATTGDIIGLLLPAQKVSAVLYGTIQGNDGLPIANLPVDAVSSAQTGVIRGLTGSDGSYCIPVVPGLWFAYVDDQALLAAGYVLSGGFPVTPVSEGQAVEVSYTATKTTAHLRGKVVDSDGSPVPGLIMDAVGTVSDTVSYSVRVSTALDGSFDIPAMAGAWTITADWLGAAARGLYVTGNLAATVIDGQDQHNLQYVVQCPTVHITGYVKDSTDAPVGGITFEARGGDSPYVYISP